jgi:hypothetical protein
VSVPAHQLEINPTDNTADVVAALRLARTLMPREGSICAALDAADPAGELSPDAYGEAVAALKVGALVFGIDDPACVGAHQPDAAYVFDIAVYNLTGAQADVPAALAAFSRAAGPELEPTRT